jgi:2-amino-4-hydroxy-6-hydroxymethyldihydropteridine diphosphokinase
MKYSTAAGMSLVYLSLGSNLGDRLAALRAALSALPPAVTVLVESPVYETPPWGVADQPAFLNMAVQAETLLAPLALLAQLKHLETRLGRLPSIRYGPRKIDLDILFYDNLVLDTPELTLPHPRLHERAFVLVPLADLAPDLVHPRLGKPVRDLLRAVDTKGIKRYG